MLEVGSLLLAMGSTFPVLVFLATFLFAFCFPVLSFRSIKLAHELSRQIGKIDSEGLLQLT